MWMRCLTPPKNCSVFVLKTPASLTDAACTVLHISCAVDKARATERLAVAWQDGAITEIGDQLPPDRPARPHRPELRLPRDMPKRHAGSTKARVALLHALAHIELNAIDLAWDIIARFGPGQPRAFCNDWVTVAREEAKHFLMLQTRLADFGAAYGDLPAHDGLWEAATETAHDLLARLAIVPLVLEARGLDVTPAMIKKLEKAGDPQSAAVLQVIYQDEIGHVAIGVRWFERLCQIENIESKQTWKMLVNRHFRGTLKPPFNVEARQMSGFQPAYYVETP